MRLILVVAILFSLAACSRSVTRNASTSTNTKETETNITDSYHSVYKSTMRTSVTVGDTLAGSFFLPLFLPPSDSTGVFVVDSLESSGIKVKAVLYKSDSVLKARIVAVAKPKSYTNESTLQAQYKAVETAYEKEKEQTVTTQSSKSSKSNYTGVGLVIVIICVIVILLQKKLRT